MKRMNKVFGLLAMAAIVFSCAKETPVNEETVTPGEEQTGPKTNLSDLDPSEYLLGFGGTIENQTKVNIDVSTGELSFENNDEALVYVPATEATGTYKYNNATSLFEPKTDGDAVAIGDNYALVYYPAASFNGASSGNVTFTMPTAVTAGDDAENLGDKNPMSGLIVAGSRDDKGNSRVVFKNLCSILRVSLTGNVDDQAAGKTVSSVTLSNTTVPIAAEGTYTVSWDGYTDAEANVPSLATSASGYSMSVTSSITLDPDTATDFYFLLPPTGTMEGMTVTATLSDDASYVRTRSNLTIERSKILTLAYRAGVFYDGAGTAGDPWQIKTADDFKQISKRCAADGDYLDDEYIQVADINFGTDGDHKSNLSGYMIGTSANPFTGKYNGNTHSLNYFSLSGTNPVGLFQYIGAATIDDVVVSGFSVNATKQAGAIVGYVNDASAKILNCETSEGTIFATTGEAGGIVGRVQVAGTEITDCINGANVTNTTNNNNNIGGIVGYSHADITITRCSNSGTIDNQSGAQVGGIIGRCAADVTISNCSNSGIIRSYKGIAGGIVGTFATAALTASTVTGCSNTGAVLVSEDNADNIGGIVGRMYSGIVSRCRNHGHIGAWSTTDGTSFTALDVNNHAVGGIVGLMNTGVVQECYGGIPGVSKAWIRGGENIGGIVGCASTDNSEKIYIINCFNRTSAQSSNSGDAPIGGIVGYANANKMQIDIMNCLNWGSAYLLNTNGSNTSSCIGGLVGKGDTGASVNLNIRNCMAVNTRGTIMQRVGSEDKAINELDLTTYQTYGLIYGLVSGKTLLRDIYYRTTGSGASYMGTNSSSYSGVRNMKTGVSDNVAKNTEVTTLNICKNNTETYEFNGYMYAGLTRGSYSPSNESVKLSVGTYNSVVALQLSDWVSVSGMSGYSLPKALVDLGIDYYNR